MAGINTITTHVPSGGKIADATTVLQRAFGSRSVEVDARLREMALLCANAIDNHYQGKLGEMSMDIGIDGSGTPWFFEANSKPMKFDEPDIRAKSLDGVLQHLEELRSQRIRSERIKSQT